MTIRPAGPDDHDALLRLRCALWPHRDLQQHDDELRRRVQARVRHETLLLEDATGGACGFVELTRDHPEPGQPGRVFVQALFVSPASRGRGAARLLLAAAERWAHGRGARVLACEIDAGDTVAREAMAGLGFGDAEERVRLSRRISAPLEVTRAAPAPDLLPGAQTRARPAIRPALLVVNLTLFAAAIASFAATDIYAKDMLHGVLLPLLDAIFVVYFLFLFMMLRYRRRADSSARAERLFRGD